MLDVVEASDEEAVPKTNLMLPSNVKSIDLFTSTLNKALLYRISDFGRSLFRIICCCEKDWSKESNKIIRRGTKAFNLLND